MSIEKLTSRSCHREVDIEKLPSGKYRAVVRHGGAKRASEAVSTVAEAKMLEAKVELSRVRLGNASTIEVYDVLRDHQDEIARFADSSDEAMLIIR